MKICCETCKYCSEKFGCVNPKCLSKAWECIMNNYENHEDKKEEDKD